MKNNNEIVDQIKALSVEDYLSENYNSVSDVMPYREFLQDFDIVEFKNDIVEIFESKKEVIVKFDVYEFFAVAYVNEETQFGIDINGDEIFVYVN